MGWRWRRRCKYRCRCRGRKRIEPNSAGRGWACDWRSRGHGRIRQSFKKSHHIANFTGGERWALRGQPIERRAVAHNVGEISIGQIIGHTSGTVPSLWIGVAGGIKGDHLVQIGKDAVVHKILPLCNVSKRGHAKSATKLLDRYTHRNIGAQRRLVALGPTKPEIKIGRVGVGRNFGVSGYACRIHCKVSE